MLSALTGIVVKQDFQQTVSSSTGNTKFLKTPVKSFHLGWSKFLKIILHIRQKTHPQVER